MTYPGDAYYFVLPINKAGGGDPDVTSTPTITIISLVDNVGVTGHISMPMTLIPGTQKVYKYMWDTTGLNEGSYQALVDYAAEGATFQGIHLETVRLGDSRIKGTVALEATTAKNETVAKEATVMKVSDFVHPNDASHVQYIKSKVAGLPADVASAEAIASVLSMVTDIKDAEIGTWLIDKVTNVLTMRRTNGNELARFQLSNDNEASNRVRL
jgi:hypothetical protein